MKIFYLLAFVLFSTITHAQKLAVTPNGLRNANDTQKTFIVIPTQGKTAKQLYEYIPLQYSLHVSNYKKQKDV